MVGARRDELTRPSGYPRVMTPEARALALSLFDEERRHPVGRHGEAMEASPSVVRIGPPGRGFYMINHSSFDDDVADDVIERELAHHAEIGVDFEWKVYAHDRPADLRHRLERRGFVVGPKEAVLVYDLSEMGPPNREAASDVTVARVVDPSRLADYREVTDSVFGESPQVVIDELVQSLAERSTRYRAYVAYAGGTPVSAGRLSALPGSAFGGLWGGATRSSHRGRGYYRALVRARAEDALALGLRYLMVDALPTSRPTLERLGFQRITDTWPCEWRAGARR